MGYVRVNRGPPWQKVAVRPCYEVALAHVQGYNTSQLAATLNNRCNPTQEHVACSQRFLAQRDASLAEDCSPLLAVANSINFEHSLPEEALTISSIACRMLFSFSS